MGGGVVSEGPYLILAMWTPKGHGLITVKDYDIFYRPAPRSSTGYRVTDTGIPGRIFNGVPDWLYEGKLVLKLSNNIYFCLNLFFFCKKDLTGSSKEKYPKNSNIILILHYT